MGWLSLATPLLAHPPQLRMGARCTPMLGGGGGEVWWLLNPTLRPEWVSPDQDSRPLQRAEKRTLKGGGRASVHCTPAPGREDCGSPCRAAPRCLVTLHVPALLRMRTPLSTPPSITPPTTCLLPLRLLQASLLAFWTGRWVGCL